jgi:hypothetical protein
MSTAVGVPLHGLRVKFDRAFPSDAPSHHINRRDVERTLRWPRWVDELTQGAELALSDAVTVWVATPPTSVRDDPSSLLVVTRDRRSDRWVHGAWRLYHSDVDLRHARSGFDVLTAFLDRYGLEVQIGDSSRRLFLPCRLPMAAAANASARVIGVLSRPETRRLEILRLIPERAEIEVGVAFAVDERSLRADVARHLRSALRCGMPRK